MAHEAARRGRAAELPARSAGRAARSAPRGRHRVAPRPPARRPRPAGGRRERRRQHRARRAARASATSWPCSTTFAADPQARALFLFPTKALAQDQARKLDRLPACRASCRPSTTATRRRTSAPLLRRTATILLSNPDMLHVGILPGHERWAEFLHHLRYVVLDEAHVYRGVFGSHVAQVVRRLRRLCAPVRLATRASCSPRRPSPTRRSSPSGSSALPFAAVDEDQAPRPERTVVLLEPAARGPRRAASAAAPSPRPATSTAECVLAGARVIAFAPTRKAAELVYGHVRRRLEDRDAAAARPSACSPTAPATRRSSGATSSGACSPTSSTPSSPRRRSSWASTSAASTSRSSPASPARSPACASAGDGPAGPGTAAPCWWPARTPSTSTSCASPSASWAAASRRRSSTCTTRTSAAPHLEAAAYERPLTPHDEALLRRAGPAAGRAAGAGRPAAAARATAWSGPGRTPPPPSVGLRTAEQRAVRHRRGARSGEVIGTVERERVFRFAHPGAVYLHLGRSYLVQRLDLEARTVLVDDFDGGYYTQAKTDKNVLVAGQADSRALPGAALFFGELEVTEQVIAYQKRDMTDGHVIDTTTLDLPEQAFTTQAFWLAVPQPMLDGALGRRLGRDRRARRPPAPCTPPSTRSSPCCRCTPCATAGTSAASAPPGTGRPTRRASSSTTATPAASACRAAATTPSRASPPTRAHARRRVPLRERLPQLRAEPQVRQPQRAAEQGRRGGACCAPCWRPGSRPHPCAHAAPPAIGSGTQPRRTACPHDITIETLDPADIELVGPLWKQLHGPRRRAAGRARPGAARPTSPGSSSARRCCASWRAKRSCSSRARTARVVGLRLRLHRGPRPRLVHRRQARRARDPLRRPRPSAATASAGALLDAVDAELERRGVEDVEIGVDTGNAGRRAPLRAAAATAPTSTSSTARRAARPWACLRARPRTGRPGAAASRRPAPRRTHERAEVRQRDRRQPRDAGAGREGRGARRAPRGARLHRGLRRPRGRHGGRRARRQAQGRRLDRHPAGGRSPARRPRPHLHRLQRHRATRATSAWSPAATW